MKNNLISAIAGWKSAALLALVAMVAAVAFSGILTTQSADAAGPGDTTTVTVTGITEFTEDQNDGIATFEITGGTASASFAANGGQTLVCANDAACDSAKDGKDDGTGTSTNHDPNSIRVAITIDEDSANGFILITITDANPADGTGISKQRINVSTTDRVVALTASAAIDGEPAPAPAVSATQDTSTPADAGVVITARLTNNLDNGVTGKQVIIYTTLGVLNGCADANGVQACTESSADVDDDDAETNDAGYVSVRLLPTGRPGVATVNFTQGEFNATVSVVFFGAASAIEASAMQSSIAIGGDTYIVVSVVDSADNPVVGHEVDKRGQGAAGGDALNTGVVGPAAKSVNVDAVDTKDFIHPTNPKANLPACGDDPTVNVPADGDTPAVAASPFTAGTNAAGKCVFYVSAPNPAGTVGDATRGANTVHIAGPAADKSADVAVEIQVGGPPSSISTDAPAYVEPLSSTKVTITVVDDEEVLVGAIPASVFQVEGSGKVIAGEGEVMTSDGTVSFTYLAPSSPGTAVFRVTAGTAGLADNVVVTIGSAPVEVPDAPPATWNDELVSGAQNVVWNGDDGADVADGSAEGVTAIWQWNGTGWDGYFPAAADVPGGNTLSTLSNGAAYWVIVD